MTSVDNLPSRGGLARAAVTRPKLLELRCKIDFRLNNIYTYEFIRIPGETRWRYYVSRNKSEFPFYVKIYTQKQ